MASSDIRRHYLVKGRVQGVGFRNFIHHQANGLGVKGLVRNLIDGRVEILARGDERTMNTFDLAVARGPVHAHVTTLEKKDLSAIPMKALDEARDFTVAEDGETAWKF